MKKLMDVRTGDARSDLSKFTIEVVQMAIVETSKVAMSTRHPLLRAHDYSCTHKTRVISPQLVITSAEDVLPNTR